MFDYVTKIKQFFRKIVSKFARFLNNKFGEKVTPNLITYIGLVMHIPIAYFIASGSLIVASIFLIVFGLFDTLDGELARLQKKDSVPGMFLDASTDRFKEVILYAGIIYYAGANHYSAIYLVFVLVALGSSLSVSYVKAKGEAAISTLQKKFSHQELNRFFSSGMLSYEVRMTLLVIGLLFNIIMPVVILIAVFSSYTVLTRLNDIMDYLKKS